jgi:hypothetical protein
VAALAGELVEAPRNRERSFCCGAGGGLAFLGEETGERVSHNRARNWLQPARRPYRRSLPILQYHVPGCAGSAPAKVRAATAGHCPVGGARIAAIRPPARELRQGRSFVMKIIVAIKQVPERDAQVRIDADGKWIDEPTWPTP